MILHTEVSGTGEALIFLHTGLQTGKTELDLQKEYFDKKYEVILTDLRGHGKSVTNDYSDYFENTAKDLAETLDNLDIKSAHIVGCSLGALAGLIFAKTYPEKVTSLTLSGIMSEKPADWESLNQKDKESTAEILSNPEAEEYFNSIHKGDWKKLLKTTEKSDWYPFDQTADLSMLDFPVLYIVGENNPRETAGALSYPKMNKNIHVSIIPFAGHTVHLDQSEIYNKTLEMFLNKYEK
ncbi:alpha/beta fold hydrolase [Jeotgalicoccus psychrophilus]|uniref:alpha/beta fold hydrolase n=1 Tax=Jeotgalicoccus psychrophilus TaxID=157228 RepID=UPI00041BE018|nr:alpha/beta hydrolase [Jeotgalicoccus psychrophilus]